MAVCRYVRTIKNTENIGDSLLSINNNFANLDTALCNLKKRVESLVDVRTFFYYGPNSGRTPVSSSNPGYNMQDGVTSRPSDLTITNFVNNFNELNLPAISKTGDQVYVIYQKTGFVQNQNTRVTSGVATANNQQVAWSTTTPDKYNIYSPVFIIWKLTAQAVSGISTVRYAIDSGFPKFTQSETASTNDWNNPTAWAQTTNVNITF